MLESSAYLGMFLSAFGAATLLPLQSEAVLVGLLLSERYHAGVIWAVATCGNVLGSILNWCLGGFIERWRHRAWFPVSAAQLERAQARYQRYGWYSLLLSWVPIVGDPLTVVAGMMREPLWRFACVVAVAKGGRYLVLVWLTNVA